MAKEKPDSPTHEAMRQAAWGENTAADVQRPAGNLAVEYRNIDALIPYVNNARTHSDDQVAQIAASIKEFGWTNPVLVDGDNGIIAGHGRVQAARKLGHTNVPVIELQGLSDDQRRAYILADNRLAQNAGWDEDLLHLELSQLDTNGFDLSLLGFSLEELGAAAGDLEEGLTDPDEVPAVPADPITRPGDLWQLGEHRLLCGDSTAPGDVEQLMSGEKAALVHADPPYGMGKETAGVENDNLYREKLDAFQMAWWRVARSHLEDNGSGYIWGTAPDLWRLWYAGGLADSERMTMRNEIVWDKKSGQGMSSDQHRMFPTATERCLFFMLGEQGFNNNADNYWDGWEPLRAYLAGEADRMSWGAKDIQRITGVGMYSHWFSKSQWVFIPRHHYMALRDASENKAFLRPYDALDEEKHGLMLDPDRQRLLKEFYGSRAYFDNAHENMTDVWKMELSVPGITDMWEFDRVLGEERYGHATPKPVAMMERVMKSSLPPGGLCYEPFAGSGSTLMGAQRTGRKCYTMELTPGYCDVIVQRWEAFTGKTATLAGYNGTIEQLRQEREHATSRA